MAAVQAIVFRRSVLLKGLLDKNDPFPESFGQPDHSGRTGSMDIDHGIKRCGIKSGVIPAFLTTGARRQVFSTFALCLVLGVVGWAALTGPAAAAAEAVLHTSDGRIVMGDFVSESEQEVVLGIDGAKTTFPRSQVVDLQVILTQAELFAERRKVIADDDLSSRVDLVAQMIDEKVYDLAKTEIDALATDFPDEPFAKGLEQLLKTAQAGEALAAVPEPKAGDNPRLQTSPRGGAEATLLTKEQVIIVKLGERHRPDPDSAIKLVIPPTVITELFDLHTGHPAVPDTRDDQAAFRDLNTWEQLAVFERVDDNGLTGKIRIVGDPPALKSFRQTINPRYIWSYFGRHFSGTVEGVDLAMRRPNAVPEAYTNFVKLSRMQVDGHKMINRMEPEKSLLLQWGLPREIATHPAPEAERWKPYFQSRQDPQYLSLLDWIDALVTSPDYLSVLPKPLSGGGALE